jgi:pyruvate dehydrogenase E2 component (dihydrolipoamide acetyltransferase)
MPVSVTMPRLGESVTEGTVTRWLKNEGDHVDADEPLLEVSTDKVDTEIPSPASGTLTAIKVREDETVKIGVELAIIGDGDGAGASQDSKAPAAEAEGSAEPDVDSQAQTGEAADAGADADRSGSAPEPDSQPAQQLAPEPEPEEQAEATGASTEQPSHDETETAPEPQRAPAQQQPQRTEQSPAAAAPDTRREAPALDDEEGQGTYVTPLVRKLASEHGVDLSTVEGTGVGGRIRKSDVLAAAQSKQQTAAAATRTQVERPAPEEEAAEVPAAARARGRVENMSRLRQVIASRMVESLRVSAQLTTVVEVDVTRIARLRDRTKDAFAAREGVKLSFLPFFALATVEALKLHPSVNASIDADAKTITYHDSEHLGIAVDTERGLLVPVIHDAGDLNLAGLARKIADLAERTRTNKVNPDELGGGTFTLTNTGSRGALFDTPIINQPQVAILGTGAVVKRPVVIDDEDLGETIAVRSMVYLALTYDHRIVDGADAARFLATVKKRLEDGDFAGALGG